MATVGFSEAAKLAGVSRQHLYKMADAGQISIVKEILPGKSGDNPKDFRRAIDVAELHRVFGQLTAGDSVERQLITPDDSEKDSDYRVLEAELNAARQLLRDREDQLRQAQEREEWLKKQVDETQNVVKLLGHSMPEKPEPAEDMIPAEEYQKAMENGQAQIDRLVNALEREKNRGFWSRLFGK